MATSAQHDQENKSSSPDGNRKDLSCYMPLYKAASEGDWESAKKFFESDPDAMVARISDSSKTSLHIAALSGHTQFVEELVQLMPVAALELKDSTGHTALYFSVVAGNIKAAEAMVRKNPNLPQIRNDYGYTPILEAALLGHKDLLLYLSEVTRDEDPSPFGSQDGVRLLNAVIAADFYDVALHLVQKNSQLAISRDRHEKSALDVLARRPSAFLSGSGLGFWQRYIYSWVHVEQESTPYHTKTGDTENPTQSPRCSSQMSHTKTGDTENPTQGPRCRTQMSTEFQFLQLNQIIQVTTQRLNGLFWNALKHLVPSMNHVYDTKVMHIQALGLMKYICEQVLLLSKQSERIELVKMPFMVAAEYGTTEFISHCLETFPSLIWTHYEDCHTILHIAIEYRQEKVFNLIRGVGASTNVLASYIDPSGNNILHLAAKLAPSPKLKVVSGAALQMQRELQWFKEVEKITKPTYKELKNSERKRPRVMFTDEHEDLVEKGEKWMRATASSCSLVATLIATVVFTAAFTVPGGNRSEIGIPIFHKNIRFIVFAISDALALFSSLTSVLIFLSVLTSHYAEEDFLNSLPRKLIIGLSTLFLSIATMEIAFCATYFIMFDHKLAWLAILVALLAGLPVTLFALLQFPLFFEIVRSTYGSDVFHR